jgi:dihydrofolate reductase
MRKLSVNTFLSLDGVMQAPGGPDEDRSGGFEHGGWAFGYWDDAMGQVMDEYVKKPFDLLLGRKTYEIFAAHWPHADPDDPIGRKLNAMPKHVASRTLSTVDWTNSRLLDGDAAGAVAELKRRPGGEIQVHGSGGLIQTLMEHDLVDEYRLWIAPILLGAGRRLFAGGARPAGFELAETTTATTGVVLHVYRRAGEVRYGSMAIAD